MQRRRLSYYEDCQDENDDLSINKQTSSASSTASLNNKTEMVTTAMNDLPSPSPSPTLLWATKQHQQQVSETAYVPRTLHGFSHRYRILPAFPTSFYNDQPTLLLPNVPIHKLNEEQLLSRQSGRYPLLYTINHEKTDTPSNLLSEYQTYMSSLIYKYNVDESILDYNLARFKICYETFIDDYCYHHDRCSPEDFELHTRQKKYALEFYLQMDVDLFFMKTCSFRSAKPRSVDEGLFCIDEPDSRYGLLPCNNCSLCVPSPDLACQQSKVQCGPHQRFRFMNGYETILNCSANCQTRNIIYAMICPCNNAEYIGETSQRLNDRLWYHRQHFNRIIHEFLIGEANAQFSRTQMKDYETVNKDRMRLYKHAARCPWAMGSFLKSNPIYRCFVPVTVHEAMGHDRNYLPPPTLILYDTINPTSIGSRYRDDVQGSMDTRSDEAVRSCMRQIPPLPTGYTFSIRQRIEQFQYFKNKKDMSMKPDQFVNLFNSVVIAVLPVDAVDIVRKFVEALFITHTETNLNTVGRLFDDRDGGDDSDPLNNSPLSIEEQLQDRGDWCRNVVVQYYFI